MLFKLNRLCRPLGRSPPCGSRNFSSPAFPSHLHPSLNPNEDYHLKDLKTSGGKELRVGHLTDLLQRMPESTKAARQRFVDVLELDELSPSHPGVLLLKLLYADHFKAFPLGMSAANELLTILPDDETAQRAHKMMSRAKAETDLKIESVMKHMEQEKEGVWEPTPPIDTFLEKELMNECPLDFDQTQAIRERWAKIRRDYDEDMWLRAACEIFSVYTGEVEGVYKLSPGVTELYLRNGMFPRTFQPHEVMTLQMGDEHEPEKIEQILMKQRDEASMALQMVKKGGNIFTNRHLCSFHRATMALTPWIKYDGVDVFVSPGAWKYFPNHVQTERGDIHAFCPPKIVEEEMSKVFDHFAVIRDRPDVDPCVKAAWLHQALTNVHPFADGNGRMARLLASVSLFEDFLPLFVVQPDTDTNREGYLMCVQAADRGDLWWLSLFIQASLSNFLAKMENVLAHRSKSFAERLFFKRFLKK